MQAHEGESILSYLLSVPTALGKTKPPSGGGQGVISTLATNKQTNIVKKYPTTLGTLRMRS